MPPKKQATPNNRPSSQLPVYSPEWYKARHREGKERAEAERRQIDPGPVNVAPVAAPVAPPVAPPVAAPAWGAKVL